MILNPIIPIWVMAIICVFFLCMKRKGIGNYIRQILIIALLFVINMRVMVRDGDIPTVMPQVDILFVVDNTISMLAEDYGEDDGRRIDAVREDCRYITERFPGASFSVVKFDDNVEMMMPYTVDANMTIDTIGLLQGPSQYHAKGTSLNRIMENLEDILDDGRKNFKMVFFISDGEALKDEKLQSYGGISKHIDAGAVLGYGTQKGGPMIPYEPYLEESEQTYLYYYDDNYKEHLAISKIDEGNLKSIASDLGVDYVHMTKQSEIDGVIKSIQGEVSNLDMQEDTESKEGYKDTYYWAVIVLIILLAIDFICYRKKM